MGFFKEKNFLRYPMGVWDFVESFTDDVKVRGFLSKVSSLSPLPWKKSNLVFRRTRIKAPARISAAYYY